MVMPDEAEKEKEWSRTSESKDDSKWTAILALDSHSLFHLSVACEKPSKSTKILLLLLLFFPLVKWCWVGFFCNQEVLTKSLLFFIELKDEPGNCTWLGRQGESCKELKTLLPSLQGVVLFYLCFSINQISQSQIFFLPTSHPLPARHSNCGQPSTFTKLHVLLCTSFWRI